MSDRTLPVIPGGLVTAGVLMLSGMTIMANATIAPALLGLREHYADVAGIETLAGLILTLPSLAIVLSAGVVGYLADKIDRQKLLMLSGLLYALGGTSGLWVDSLTGMLAGRVVLGVGVAGTMVLATTWAADIWQGEARARFLGLQGAAMSAGGIVVIVTGGALSSLHWRGAFGTYLMVVPVTLLALVALAPYARRRQARAEGSSTVATDAVFPWRAFAFVGSLGFAFMTAFYVMPTRLPFLLGEVGVASPMILGLVMSLMTLAAIPGALFYGRIRHRLSIMAVFALSWALMGLGMLILSTASSLPMMALGVATVGVGMGPSMPNYMTYWMAVVPPSLRGRASGLLTMAFFAGQFASPLVSAPLVGAFGLRGTFETLGLAQVALAVVLGAVALLEPRTATA